jgi:hypothetical protein
MYNQYEEELERILIKLGSEFLTCIPSAIVIIFFWLQNQTTQTLAFQVLNCYVRGSGGSFHYFIKRENRGTSE